MNNDIYEVDRDAYAGIIGQINPKTSDIETYHEDYGTIIKIKNKEGVHFTTRIIPTEGEEQYYIFTLPQGEDCLPPKKIRKITLETKEEVQAFFDVLNKVQQEAHKND